MAQAVGRWGTIATCFRWWIRGVFAIPLTKGFADVARRSTHYEDHAKDFGASSHARYEQMADRFLGQIVPAGTLFECHRPGGDLVRYDPRSNELGILSATGIIRTYYKPKFCKDLTPAELLRVKCHNRKTHMEYVIRLCHQTF